MKFYRLTQEFVDDVGLPSDTLLIANWPRFHFDESLYVKDDVLGRVLYYYYAFKGRLRKDFDTNFIPIVKSLLSRSSPGSRLTFPFPVHQLYQWLCSNYWVDSTAMYKYTTLRLRQGVIRKGY